LGDAGRQGANRAAIAVVLVEFLDLDHGFTLAER
jgi:hypothetical protein